jgi:hypothetical protein
MENFEKLKKQVQEIEADVVKAEAGNKAAITRVRVAMQAIKVTAQEVRIEVFKK